MTRERPTTMGQFLKRALINRPSGDWNDDDDDVLADGGVVGRIMKVHAAPVSLQRLAR
jgi:hypothetical protein